MLSNLKLMLDKKKIKKWEDYLIGLVTVIIINHGCTA